MSESHVTGHLPQVQEQLPGRTGPVLPSDLVDFDARSQAAQRIYRPLREGQIRVFHLQPGKFADDLCGALYHRDLKSSEDEPAELTGNYGTCSSPASISDIEPQNDNQHLHTSVEMSTGACGGYEALSYVWGKPDFVQTLHVRACEPLKISSALAVALRYLRHAADERVLWIDAICINQTDSEERSSQVSVMADIFEMADCVTVWLGEDHEIVPLAYATMDALSAASLAFGIEEGDFIGRGQDTMDQLHAELVSRLQSNSHCNCCGIGFAISNDVAISGLLAVWKLFHRPWFSRLWVLQEVTSSIVKRTLIQTGTHRTDQYRLADCLYFTERLANILSAREESFTIEEARDIGIDCVKLLNLFRICNHEEFNIQITLEQLVLMHGQSCQDPRDRVFAFRRLLSIEDLAPNYDNSVAEVYTRFATICHEKAYAGGSSWFPGSLLALVGTETERPVAYNLPSWVPNFNALSIHSKRKIQCYQEPLRSGDPGQFHPSFTLFRLRFRSDHKDTFNVHGRIFAQIGAILPSSQWPDLRGYDSTDLGTFRSWYKRCAAFANPVLREIDFDMALMDFLICGYVPKASYEHSEEHYNLLVAEVESTVGLSPSELESTWDFTLNNFTGVAFDSGHHDCLDRGRLLCHSEGEGGQDICWIPKHSQVGDQLCVFAGCPFPFVVRSNNDGTYKLLGDAYTARVTLVQALGGEDTNIRSYACLEEKRPEFMDWNTKSRQMRQLIRGMDWMTLR